VRRRCLRGLGPGRRPSVRPQQANTLAEQAARRLEAALGDPDTLSADDRSDLAILLSPMLTAVVQALVDTGSVDRARAVMACVPEKRHTGLMGMGTGMDTLADARTMIAEYLDDPDEEPSAQALAQQAYRLADDNKPDEARQRLHQTLEAVGSPLRHGAPPRETWLISLCAARSYIGRHGDSAHLAGSLRDPAEQVQALAAAAVSAAAAGHLDDARRLAYEAADRTRALDGADNFSFLDGAPGRDVADAEAHQMGSTQWGPPDGPHSVGWTMAWPRWRSGSAGAGVGATARRRGCVSPRCPRPVPAAAL
jgi:hypothetical protein